MLQMSEMGLVGEWLNRNKHQPKMCFASEKQRRKEEIRNPPRLTLKNMSGTYVMLGVGFAIALCVLIAEKIYVM